MISLTSLLRFDEYCQNWVKTENSRTFFQTDENRKPFVDKVLQIIHQREIQVLSFDVFDTALLRNGDSEARRFLNFSQYFFKKHREEFLDKGITAQDLFLARIYGARAAYAMAPSLNGIKEGTLNAIAHAVCESIGFSDLAESYIQSEIDFEIDALTANPLVETIKSKVSDDISIIFISDMYLDSIQIEEILESVLKPSFKYEVFSSADGNGNKGNGKILEYIKDKYDLLPQQILHIGDNLKSDFQVPLMKGLSALYFPIPDLERNKRSECYFDLCKKLGDEGINLKSKLAFNY